MLLNQNNLIHLLHDLKLEPTLQTETNQVYATLYISRQEVPVFFGILGEGTLLQTIAYLPFEINDSKKGEVARLLHLINKELDMPGFGMDEVQKLMFYRCVIPCLNGEIAENILDTYVGTTKVACETFMSAIALIASGSANVDDILKERAKPNPS